MLTGWMAWLRSVLSRRQIDGEIGEELRFHVERETDANVARGVPPDEARRVALRDLGGLAATAEAVREVRSMPLDTLGRDVAIALRRLAHERTFTVTAVLVLAFGIGANTAAFSVVYGIYWRPLPGMANPDALVEIMLRRGADHAGGYAPFDAGMVEDVAARSDLFEDAAAASELEVDLRLDGEPTRAAAVFVTPRYFQTLGTPLIRGRPLATSGGGDAFLPEAVISDALWRDHFSRSEEAISAQLFVNGVAFTVVGVAPARFVGPGWLSTGADTSRVWVPAGAYTAVNRNAARFTAPQIIARVHPGLSASAATGLTALVRRWADDGRRIEGYELHATPLGGAAPAGAMLRMLVVFALPAVVLLIACVNLGALLLARGVARAREVALRRALGASRWRIVRQHLVEDLVLAFAGAAIGLVLSFWTSAWFVARLPLPPVDVSPDVTVLGVTIATCVAAVLLFGLAPAVAASRTDPMAATGISAAATPPRQRLQRTLVAAQVALTLMLLAAGGAMLQAVRVLAGVDPGFDAGRSVLASRISLDPYSYDREARQLFRDELARRLSDIPGVEAAALADRPPFFRGCCFYASAPDHRTAAGSGGIRVSADYFRTLGLAIVRGRGFDESDIAGAPLVTVVSETFARAAWPDEDALGRSFRIDSSGGGGSAHGASVVVVGVVRDTHGPYVLPMFYLPMLQHTAAAGVGWEQVSLLVRSDHQPAAALPRIQDVVRHLDPNLAVYEAETLDARAHRMLEVERALSYAVNGLAVAALWLAAIGAFGVMAYGMARRTRELAVRIALGARRADVVRLALGEGARIAAAGIPIGLLLAVPVGRATGGLVAGLAGTAPIGGEPIGPAAAAAVIVAGAMLAASYLPARRAARVDPALVFRSE